MHHKKQLVNAIFFCAEFIWLSYEPSHHKTEMQSYYFIIMITQTISHAVASLQLSVVYSRLTRATNWCQTVTFLANCPSFSIFTDLADELERCRDALFLPWITSTSGPSKSAISSRYVSFLHESCDGHSSRVSSIRACTG